MRALGTLIRLRKEALVERRARIALLEARCATLVAARDRFERELLGEQRTAAARPELLSAYGAYAARSGERRQALRAEMQAAEGDLAAARAALLDAFAELKKYEIALRLHERRARAEAVRRERLALDEVALNGCRRR